MPNILLPILPGEMPSQYCFTTWQQLLIDLSAAQNAVLPGQTFFNYGDTIPAPEFVGYPWLRTTDMRWYRYDGAWLSPHPVTSQAEVRMFDGEAEDVTTYDGGDGNAPSDRSGPMWEVVAEFVGRVPIGVGTIPGSTTPVVTTGVGDEVGAAEHTLTAAEGATADHIHPFGITNQDGSSSGDDAYFNRSGLQTVPGYTGFYITGSATKISTGLTQADLFTLPAGATGAGVTAVPFSVVQPSRAVYFLRRTSRVYYKV